MALSESEIKNETTLDLLTQLTNSAFPVGYARIESWNINQDDPSFTAVLALYLNEETRRQNKKNCTHYHIGCTPSEEMLASFRAGDDRVALYAAVEYIVHYQIYTQGLSKIEDSEKPEYAAEKNAVLEALGQGNLFTMFYLKTE
jgi:hypothetical protein